MVSSGNKRGKGKRVKESWNHKPPKSLNPITLQGHGILIPTISTPQEAYDPLLLYSLLLSSLSSSPQISFHLTCPDSGQTNAALILFSHLLHLPVLRVTMFSLSK
ncbi:hypothetical protein L1049_026562 [Liquidambar formosana]|uniref:Uncharacterized protein n=1 Tax=Liquidambar formosana TaxID=63359 RepID=A0AAP0R7G0_LIQFO